MPNVAVVGGGMMGLTVGLRLAQRGHAVRVYEGERKVGGLAAAGDIGPWSWDRFYHVILMSDTALTGLLGEVGLQDTAALGNDAHRVLRRWPVDLDVLGARVPALPAAQPGGQGAARRHHPDGVADQRSAPAGEGWRARMAGALVGAPHHGANLGSIVASEAG